MVIDW